MSANILQQNKEKLIQEWFEKNKYYLMKCPAMGNSLIRSSICEEINSRPTLEEIIMQSIEEPHKPKECENCLYKKQDTDKRDPFNWWKEKINNFMEENNINSYEKVAYMANINSNTLWRLMKGKNLPNITTAKKLIKLMNIRLPLWAYSRQHRLGNYKKGTN